MKRMAFGCMHIDKENAILQTTVCKNMRVCLESKTLLFTGHKQSDFDAKTGCFLVVNRWISEESEKQKSEKSKCTIKWREKKQRSTLVNTNADLFYCNKKGRPKTSAAQ